EKRGTVLVDSLGSGSLCHTWKNQQSVINKSRGQGVVNLIDATEVEILLDVLTVFADSGGGHILGNCANRCVNLLLVHVKSPANSDQLITGFCLSAARLTGSSSSDSAAITSLIS